jgi:hypothetical protein
MRSRRLNSDEKADVDAVDTAVAYRDNPDQPRRLVQTLDCSVTDGQVVLKIGSKSDVELEQWAAERGAELFREVYKREISVAKARS